MFLASVLDKTENICQNDEGEGAAEVIDQSIRMLRSIRDCRDIGTSDKEELDSLAEAFAHVLSSLNHHIAIKPVTPETVAANCFASGKEEKETAGVLLLVPLHITSASKDHGEMSLDVYVTFITIYSTLWSSLVSSTQIIQFMCLLFT